MCKEAVLADEYDLTHKETFEKSFPFSERRVFKPSVESPAPVNLFGDDLKSGVKEGDKPVCAYCKK